MKIRSRVGSRVQYETDVMQGFESEDCILESVLDVGENFRVYCSDTRLRTGAGNGDEHARESDLTEPVPAWVPSNVLESPRG